MVKGKGKVDSDKSGLKKVLENCIIALDDVQTIFCVDEETQTRIYELKEKLLVQLRYNI